MTYGWNNEHAGVPVTKVEQTDEEEDPPRPVKRRVAVTGGGVQVLVSPDRSPPATATTPIVEVANKRRRVEVPNGRRSAPTPNRTEYPYVSPQDHHHHQHHHHQKRFSEAHQYNRRRLDRRDDCSPVTREGREMRNPRHEDKRRDPIHFDRDRRLLLERDDGRAADRGVRVFERDSRMLDRESGDRVMEFPHHRMGEGATGGSQQHRLERESSQQRGGCRRSSLGRPRMVMDDVSPGPSLSRRYRRRGFEPIVDPGVLPGAPGVVDSGPPSISITKPANSVEAMLEAEKVQLRSKFAVMGVDGLVFPEIGGSSALSVNVAQQGLNGGGVGKVMVMFEDLCLKILYYRLGWCGEEFRQRIPTKRPVTRRFPCLPYFLQPAATQESLDLSPEQTLNELLSAIETPTLKFEPPRPNLKDARRVLQWTVKPEPTGSTWTPQSSSLPSASSSSLSRNKQVSLYPESLVTYYLDESKVQEGHPQRYEPVNKRFDFITRSLLWCLRPSHLERTPVSASGGSSGRPGASPSQNRAPWERSVELNADVMNVWMALIQEWSDRLYFERLRRYEEKANIVQKPGSPEIQVSSSSPSECGSRPSLKAIGPGRLAAQALSQVTWSVDREAAPSVLMDHSRQEHSFLFGYSPSSSEGEEEETPTAAAAAAPGAHLLDSGSLTKEEEQEEKETERSVASSSPIGAPKRSLFLSTDFMTTFENALVPLSTTLTEPRRESVSSEATEQVLEEGEVSSPDTPPQPPLTPQQQNMKNLLMALDSARPSSGFQKACDRVFRFFQRRQWNPWEFDYICWPINYLTAHWVLLTVDIEQRELVWADSYRRWYVEVANARQEGNNTPSTEVVPTAEDPPVPRTSVTSPSASAAEVPRRSRKPYDLTPKRVSAPTASSSIAQTLVDGFFGTEMSAEAKSASQGKALVVQAKNKDHNARLRYCGWMHFVCVEEYLKYDFRRRKSMGVDMSKHAAIESAFEANQPWARVVVDNLPQQAKMSLDCGVYAAHFARCVGQFQATNEIDFDTEHIDAFRAMMAVLIGTGQIPSTRKELAGLNDVTEKKLRTD
eukprot:Protomagalhaensia_sp_Gyna_25__77@NODE_103_length_5244_cov_44_662440_g80_i0_p1_GENE_NODE_103_length_5244_cov_44_662440_g80_i0NODE_103_length_5244_cov_44_662440_g80_i0_p1_ORF_typecomplete_len1061_score196_52Peptidase_C48/PF02902_19/1e05Peptidase_C48/PF02902_19/4_2e05_NODE_103_length_5244_cov_44_662440_g80_i019545136